MVKKVKKKVKWLPLSLNEGHEEKDNNSHSKPRHFKNKTNRDEPKAFNNSSESQSQSRENGNRSSLRKFPHSNNQRQAPFRGNSNNKNTNYNADEYTKITTPRQDVLFKKGWYLNRSKSGNSKQNPCNQTDIDYTFVPVPICTPETVSNEPFYNDMQFCHPQGGMLNQSFYGNQVVLLPCTENYFQSPNSFETNFDFNVSPKPYLSNKDASQPTDLVANTSCSDVSDLSEENVAEEEPIFQYPNEYNYNSHYLAPVYYVNIDCVPPMPFISYTAPPYLSSPDDSISATKPTDLNNSGTDADKEDTYTLEPAHSLEMSSTTLALAENSKLNVEVNEFKPKTLKFCESERSQEAMSMKTSDCITNNSLNQPEIAKLEHNDKDKVSGLSTKKRSNSTITKKFLIESNKKIELQNIDLKKSSSEAYESSGEKAVEWMIIGGKKKVVESVKPNKTAEADKKTDNENISKCGVSPTPMTETEGIEGAGLASNKLSNKKTKKPRSKSSKFVKKGKDSKNSKFEGFVIEEPNFDKKHSNVLLVEDNSDDYVDDHVDTNNSTSQSLHKDVTADFDSNDSVASIEVEKYYNNGTDQSVAVVEEINEPVKTLWLEQSMKINNEQDDDISSNENESNVKIEQATCDNSISTVEELNTIRDKSENICLSESKEPVSTQHFENDEKMDITSAVCNWLSEFDSESLKSLFTIPLNADFVKKIKYCSEISSFFDDDENMLEKKSNVLQQPFYQYKLVCEPNGGAQINFDEVAEIEEPFEMNASKSKFKSIYKASKQYFGCETM